MTIRIEANGKQIKHCTFWFKDESEKELNTTVDMVMDSFEECEYNIGKYKRKIFADNMKLIFSCFELS